MNSKNKLNMIFKILEKLFDAGFKTDKEIIKMQMCDVKKISGGLSSQELNIVLEIQEAIKHKELIPYMSVNKKEDKKNE